LHFIDVYWLEQTEADLPTENGWLSATEVTRLSGFCVPKRRADWRLGRWTAKRAVAAYLTVSPRPSALASIEIRPAPSGAPEVFIEDQPADLTVSLSHRGGVAACAVTPSGYMLGCDLELVEARSDAFVADYFTSEEQALIAQADAADRFLLVTLLWSAKESALKAMRTGLRLDTRSVIVNLGPASMVAEALSPTFREVSAGTLWHPLQVSHTGGKIFHGWWQRKGGVLRTLAAHPQPNQPILLQI
jgi:4'-phosphopantetheinyl transferase